MRIGLAYDLKSDVVRGRGRSLMTRSRNTTRPKRSAALARVLRDLGYAAVELGGGRGFLETMLDIRPARAPDLVFNIAEGQGSRSREGARAGGLRNVRGALYAQRSADHGHDARQEPDETHLRLSTVSRPRRSV